MLKIFEIPENVDEALKLKKSNLAFLAGGTEINRLGSLIEKDGVISLKKLKLNKIKIDEKSIEIGSGVTFQNLVDNKLVPAYLKKLALNMASHTRRNMATVGGNLATSRDDSYLIPMFLAVGAELELAKVGKIKFSDYVANETKYENTLILKVILPFKVEAKDKRFSNTALSHSVVNVAICKNGKDFTGYAAIKDTGIVKLALDKKNWLDEINFKDDLYTSAKYKKYILGVTAEKMVKDMGGALC